MILYREVGTDKICFDFTQFELGKTYEEVKQTESFQDLIKYGEWMPVEEG